MNVALSWSQQQASRGARFSAGYWLTKLAPRVVPILTLLVIGSYLWQFVDYQWFGPDDGTLAHSADRVLQGEVPHRDYDEAYSGLLTYINAGAFQLIGTNLPAIRYPFFVAALLFFAAMYALARRVASPLWAAAICGLGLTWGLRHSFNPMPSWYNLFLATIGALAVFRFLESQQRRWLFLAGVCGGLSICIKVIGLYYVAAILLLICFWEQTASNPGDQAIAPRRSWYSWLMSLLITLYGCLVVFLIRKHLHGDHLLQLLLPNIAVCGLLLHTEWSTARGIASRRLFVLLRTAFPFVLGVAFPLSLYALYFARQGALDDLFYGVFILPQKRIELAVYPLAPWYAVLVSGPLAFFWLSDAPSFAERPRLRRWLRYLVGAAIWLALVVLVTGRVEDDAESFKLFGILKTSRMNMIMSVAFVRTLAPVLVALGCVLLAKRGRAWEIGSAKHLQLACLTFLVAACSLTLYPFGGIHYFLYFAPLAVVLSCFLHQYTKPAGWRLRRWYALTLLIAASVMVFQHGIANEVHSTAEQHAMLTLSRAGLRIQAEEARCYETIVRLVQRHSRPGDFIYAAPDCPEVYYLADRKNPTRTLFDIFDEPVGRNERLLQMFRDVDIPVVVVNRFLGMSQPIDRNVMLTLRKLYPYSVRVAVEKRKDFLVLLREPPRAAD